MPKIFVIRLSLVVVVAAMSGCSSSGSYAPIVERGVTVKKSTTQVTTPANRTTSKNADARTQAYVIQKGDTLYSISFSYGLDYREVAEANGIQNHDLIQVGSELRIPISRGSVKAVAEDHSLDVPVKGQPRVAKLPYTEQTVVQIEKMQEGSRRHESIASSKGGSDAGHEAKAEMAVDDEDGRTEWGMPTAGTLTSAFSEVANRKGIDIAGKLGQAIVASSAGKVVYSGSGLRGYGKLIIIKHNKTYLSAYAHNDQLVVKEGQSVSKGQKIAEMGSTDSDHVGLHFEIRRFGKAVDPVKYLPIIKS